MIYDLFTCLDPQVIVGRKRHIKECPDPILNDNNSEEFFRVKKERLEVDKMVEDAENKWMRKYMNCMC